MSSGSARITFTRRVCRVRIAPINDFIAITGPPADLTVAVP
jgi:hypothetical protein